MAPDTVVKRDGMSVLSSKMRPLVAGNWKMNGLRASLDVAREICSTLARRGQSADVMIAPPATLLMAMVDACAGSNVSVAGQDCHIAKSGAHTGDIAAEMLRDAGAAAVIVGHSERRTDHGETSALVHDKAAAAHRAGLLAIICIGETQAERHAGQTLAVVAEQLAASLPASCDARNTVIAYEPVWAIGTGLTPTVDDVREVHGAIRRDLETRFGAPGSAMRILYGGSVKPENARALMSVAHVNGALVGGASLKAQDFLEIIAGCET